MKYSSNNRLKPSTMSNYNPTNPRSFLPSENSGTGRGSPATTLYMHRYLPLCLFLCAPIATSCFQTLDEGASSEEPVPPIPPDPVEWPTTHILPGPLPFGFFDSAGNLVDSDDPCKATTTQAANILLKYCAACHAGRSKDERQGIPPFDFLLDRTKLTTTFTNNTTPPILFVKQGEPEQSRLYLRARHNEMPPPDLPNIHYLRPTVSDVSVLHNWITSCL
jgi:hypothetical protein